MATVPATSCNLMRIALRGFPGPVAVILFAGRGRRDPSSTTTATARRVACLDQTSGAHRGSRPASRPGMCFVNSQNVRDLRQPFGGTKFGHRARGRNVELRGVPRAEERRVSPRRAPHIPHWGSLTNMGKRSAAKITHVPSMYLSELPTAPPRASARPRSTAIARSAAAASALGRRHHRRVRPHWLVNADYHVNCAPRKGVVHRATSCRTSSNMAYERDGNPRSACLLAETATRMGVDRAHPDDARARVRHAQSRCAT